MFSQTFKSFFKENKFMIVQKETFHNEELSWAQNKNASSYGKWVFVV